MPACKRALTTCSKLRNDMVNDPRSESGSNELYGGIAVAVFAVVLVGSLVGCASLLVPYGLPRTSEDANAMFLIGIMIAFVTFPFAAIAALIVGVPLFRLWNHFGFTSLSQYLLAGVIMSAILGATVALIHFFADFSQVVGTLVWRSGLSRSADPFRPYV
jgi:ABC-type Fe3+-siderophore transport system permease subunit